MTQTLEMTSPDLDLPQARTRHAARPSWWRRLLLDSGYNLSLPVLVVPAFVCAIAGVSLGSALLITLLGLPVLAATAYVARGFAHVERLRIRTMLLRPAPTPAYLRAPADAGWIRKAITPLRDPQSWLDVVWSVLGFATGIATFAIAVAWWAGTLGGLTYWYWERFINFGPESQNTTAAELIGLGSGRQPEIWLNLTAGVIGLLLLPVVMRLLALTHSSLAGVMLSSRAQLQQEMTRIEGGRDAARSAEAHSLRRLERDIHDGPQQRLMRLSMDLGRARKQLDDDPETARQTIDAALGQARDTVAELRALSRGIAPPILVDRGLSEALAELVARSTVPVSSRVEVARELPPHVETTVYFVASEALANVAKHSGAERAEVRVEQDAGRIVVEVSDTGRGGAQLSKGHGLAGLEQRVRAADGTLTVSSPEGGPTLIRAEVACG